MKKARFPFEGIEESNTRSDTLSDAALALQCFYVIKNQETRIFINL